MHQLQPLLSRLADGRLHTLTSLDASGQDLQVLADHGLRIDTRHPGQVRWTDPFETLDAGDLGKRQSDSRKLEVITILDSSNDLLLARSKSENIHRHVVAAEYQRNGRGRLGRSWSNPWGGSLCLSLGWQSEPDPAAAMRLPLLAGVGALRALQAHAHHYLGLKWPNDIVSWGKEPAKLAGVLLETRQTRDTVAWVIGIGVNIRIPRPLRAEIGQRCTDLTELCPCPPSRNRLLADIIRQVYATLERPEHWLRKWRMRDACLGNRVVWEPQNERVPGRIAGIDHRGQLLLLTDQGLRRFHAGSFAPLP